jgi:CRISPR-associated protein Cst1
VGEVTTPTDAARLVLTGHPLQRCGARAVAELAKAGDAEDVTPDALDAVADTLTRAVVRAASAANDAVAYDWWKVLFALYPNSPATHSKRNRDPGELGKAIGQLFAAEQAGASGSPCALCGQPASTVWGKDKLPMFDSLKAVNTLPPGMAGWPVCRACRIAMWALPYGAWVTAGSATVLSCPQDEVERRFVRKNVERARRIQMLGFTSLSADASPETVTLGALRAHGGRAAVGTTLWVFKNDNQEAWLRVTSTRGGVPAFLRALFAAPGCRAGWGALQGALTERDKDGGIKSSGVAAAARTLFDPADRPGSPAGDRLQRELLRLSKDIDKRSGRTLAAWRALCRLYLEVIHQMDVGQVKPARELITAWITQEPNPRGRFNEYVGASGRAFELQRLMMRASARLMLDGRPPADLTAVAPALFAADGNGWRLRGLLFFDVVAELVNQGVQIGRTARPGEPEEDEEVTEPRFDPDPVSDRENAESSS